jgi:hypothetical protein
MGEFDGDDFGCRRWDGDTHFAEGAGDDHRRM